jgi:hypothetical protein
MVVKDVDVTRQNVLSHFPLAAGLCASFPIAIHFTVKVEAAGSFKMFASCCIATWIHNPEDLDLKVERGLANECV